MTRTVQILAVLFVLVLILLAGRAWIDAREATIRAEAVSAQQQQIIAGKDAEIRQRDQLTRAATDALRTQAAALQTPQQAAQVIVRYLPPAAQTPVVQVTRAELPPAVQAKLPDAPGYTLITDAQASAIARNDLACDADRRDLTTCRADSADLRTELAAQQTETATWKAAAHGGTKWQRLGRALKLTGCAAAGAGLGAIAQRSSPAAPALGAAGGVVACSLF